MFACVRGLVRVCVWGGGGVRARQGGRLGGREGRREGGRDDGWLAE